MHQYIIIISAIMILLIIFVSYYSVKQQKQLQKYIDVRIGMSVGKMLQIMGSGYNVSSLKNNRQKYEWRINSSSYGYKNARFYSGVKKVDILVKDGVVEEIKPYNV